ncbi:hypothetical protein F4782DRAFT_508706, partial [Xylaria castorea]
MNLRVSLNTQTEQGAVPVAPGETTFIGFGRLLTELRLMIWEEFVRTLRIIYIDMIGDVFGVNRRLAIEFGGLVREQICPPLRHLSETHMATITRNFGFRSCNFLPFDGGDVYLR